MNCAWSSRIHLFPKEKKKKKLRLDQIGFMCACRSAETLLAGCGSFPRLPWFNGIQAFSNRTAVAWGESRCFSHWVFVGLAGSWAFPLLSLAWSHYNIYYLYVCQWTLLCPKETDQLPLLHTKSNYTEKNMGRIKYYLSFSSLATSFTLAYTNMWIF